MSDLVQKLWALCHTLRLLPRAAGKHIIWPMNATLLETVKKLPLAERVELAEALWENIADEGYEPALTPAQAAELDRRLEEHRRHPDTGIPWEQVKAELEKKHGESQ